MQGQDGAKDAGRNNPPPIAEFNVTKPIFDFETVKIHTEIDIREDLGELMGRLEKIMAMLPSKAEH